MNEFGSQQFKACREQFCREPKVRSKKKNSDKSSSSKATEDSKPSKVKEPKLRSRQYVNSQMKRILRFFKWAAAEGRFPASNFESMKLVAGLKAGKCGLPESKRVLPVDDLTVDATIRTCRQSLQIWFDSSDSSDADRTRFAE